jgi:hypothetical protein
MRRLAHRSLLLSSTMLLLATFVLPMFAVSPTSYFDEASLPACCRSHGTHHCARKDVTRANSGRRNSTAQSVQISEKCPCTAPVISSFDRGSQLALIVGLAFPQRTAVVCHLEENRFCLLAQPHDTNRPRGPPQLHHLA